MKNQKKEGLIMKPGFFVIFLNNRPEIFFRTLKGDYRAVKIENNEMRISKSSHYFSKEFSFIQV